jgi:hypothetical protein
MALELLASVFLWLMLRRAVGDRASVLVGLAAGLFTPLMLTTITWWAAGEVMLTLQFAMAAAGYFHLRFIQSRSWWSLAAAGLTILFGLAFGEKALFVPVFLGLVTVMVVREGLRQTLRTVLRLWPAWLLYAVLGAGYVAVYLRYAELGHGGAQSAAAALRLVRAQLVDVFARGMLGGPWSGSIATSGQWLPISAVGLAVLVQVLAAVAILAYRVSGRRSLVAWGCLGVYLALNVALTVRGRGFFAILLQLDPRYICDAIPIAAVALTVMFTPPADRAARVAPWAAGRPVWVAGVAVLALFNSSMVSTGRVAETLHHHSVSQYVENARLSLVKDPRAVLYDGFVPQSIMIGVFPDQEKRVSSILDAYDVKARYNRPSNDMKILDDNGVAWPITLLFAQTGQIKHRKGCGVAVQPGRPAFVQLNQLLPAGQWVMRVDYFTATSSVLNVTTTGDAQPVGFLAGPRSVFLPVESDGTVPYVEFESSEPSGVVCLTALTVGFPAPQTS